MSRSSSNFSQTVALLELNQCIRGSASNKFKIKYIVVMCALVCIFFVLNKVKEIHFQLANYLAKNCRQILIPALPVAEFVKREKSKLGKKTVKKMLAWSHYAFRQRLTSTVRHHPWWEVSLFVLYVYMYVYM